MFKILIIYFAKEKLNEKIKQEKLYEDERRRQEEINTKKNDLLLRMTDEEYDDLLMQLLEERKKKKILRCEFFIEKGFVNLKIEKYL